MFFLCTHYLHIVMFYVKDISSLTQFLPSVISLCLFWGHHQISYRNKQRHKLTYGGRLTQWCNISMNELKMCACVHFDCVWCLCVCVSAGCCTRQLPWGQFISSSLGLKNLSLTLITSFPHSASLHSSLYLCTFRYLTLSVCLISLLFYT